MVRCKMASCTCPRRRRRRRNPRPLFPIYWMVLTSFKRGSEVRTLSPSVPTRTRRSSNYRRVFEREFFWTAMRNNPIVTTIIVALALAHRLPRRSRHRPLPVPRSRKRSNWHRDRHQMVPAEALIISLFRVLDGCDLDKPGHRPVAGGPRLRPAVHDLDLRGFVGGVPLEFEEAAPSAARRFGAFLRVTLPLVAPVSSRPGSSP